jgi:hypothetical protein
MGQNNFEKDLAVERVTIKEIVDFMQSNFPVAELQEVNYDFRYDLKYKNTQNNKFFTIEVKEDFRCEDTGNIAVESESWGKTSGIEKSYATYHLFKVHVGHGKKEYLVIRTEDLKVAINNKLYFKQLQCNNLDSKNKIYLFKLKVLEDISTRQYKI